MCEDLSPIVRKGYDIGVVETVLARWCETAEERAAVRRVMGLEEQEREVINAFTPELPPPPDSRPQINHLERAHAAIARYTAWVDSHPDTDPTPLAERKRVLKNAHLDLQRLEGETP